MIFQTFLGEITSISISFSAEKNSFLSISAKKNSTLSISAKKNSIPSLCALVSDVLRAENERGESPYAAVKVAACSKLAVMLAVNRMKIGLVWMFDKVMK